MVLLLCLKMSLAFIPFFSVVCCCLVLFLLLLVVVVVEVFIFFFFFLLFLFFAVFSLAQDAGQKTVSVRFCSLHFVPNEFVYDFRQVLE